MLKPVIISAPFGNWIKLAGATSTIGTYTLHPRGGILYRLWRCLRTLRYQRGAGGWVNKLGLPNPGIQSIMPGENHREDIVSIHGFNQSEWLQLSRFLISINYAIENIEFNLSCPNTGEDYRNIINDTQMVICGFLDYERTVIIKLPPVKWMNLANPLYDLGVRYFHCCNTIPIPNGGLSGKALKNYSLWATEEIKTKWPDAKVIGGGGITGFEDYLHYESAGADYVAIGSALLNPFNRSRIKRMIMEINIRHAGYPRQQG